MKLQTDDLIPLRQVQERLGLSTRAVYRWAHEGRLPGAIQIGRSWYVQRQKLEAWERQFVQALHDRKKGEKVG